MGTALPLFIASIVGAAGLILLMPRQQAPAFKLIGALLGAAALGGVWLAVGYGFRAAGLGGMPWSTFAFYYVFSTIAIVAAVRVITHTRPVYSALWFVMVVLASAGLLLVLSAEFMAFAMIIIYAGAILVTYVFVIMLATQSRGSDDDPETSPTYDRIAREPLAAVAAGFLLMAMLLQVAFEPAQAAPVALQAPPDQEVVDTVLTRRPQLLEERIAAVEATEADELLNPAQEQLVAALEPEAAEARLANTERIGLDLFMGHPLGLELAGVILLMSLIGAVVIARTRVREEEAITGETMPDETGATAYPTHEPGPEAPETRGQSGGRVGS